MRHVARPDRATAGLVGTQPLLHLVDPHLEVLAPRDHLRHLIRWLKLLARGEVRDGRDQVVDHVLVPGADVEKVRDVLVGCHG
jgi:hypothetical protein